MLITSDEFENRSGVFDFNKGLTLEKTFLIKYLKSNMQHQIIMIFGKF